MAIITGQVHSASGTAGTGFQYDTSGRAERRLFDFGDEISELTPSETPFLTLLSKMAKTKVTDPDFKHFEHRASWKDNVVRAAAAADATNGNWSGTAAGATTAGKGIKIDDGAGVSVIGRIQKGDIVKIVLNSSGNIDRTVSAWTKSTVAIVTGIDTTSGDYIDLKALTAPGATNEVTDNDYIYVVGNANDEGGVKVSGYTDELDIRYGATQIFKTGYAMSNTLINTEFHGPHEWDRMRADKMREHKMDIERALIFGRMLRQTNTSVSSSWKHDATVTDTGTGLNRTTDGIYEFVRGFGASGQKIQRKYTVNFTWANFIDDMEFIFDQSPDPRLVLMGLSVASAFSKVGSNTFLGSLTGLNINVSAPFTKFGINMKSLETPHGDLYLVRDPVLRGKWADLMLILDMNNLEYVYLQNRDTHVDDVTAPGDDSRQENIITEAGLRIKLLESHAYMEFGTDAS